MGTYAAAQPREDRKLRFFSRNFPETGVIESSLDDLTPIPAHDHFQGGHYTFAMEKAPVERTFVVEGYSDVSSGIVKWPILQAEIGRVFVRVLEDAGVYKRDAAGQAAFDRFIASV